MVTRVTAAVFALLLGLAGAAHAQTMQATLQAEPGDIPLPLLQSLPYVDIDKGRALILSEGRYFEEGRAVRLLAPMAQGDLDSDGTRDAAVLLEERIGATATLYLSAVVQRAGRVRNMASLRLGDGVQAQALAIVDQQIVVGLLAPRAGDAPGAPSLPTTLAFRLDGSELLLMRREPGRRTRIAN
ncbi:MAG: hypothetical protein AB7R90_19695 [Reyranellaceae bacterium]